VTTTSTDDEFAALTEVADELGRPPGDIPPVERRFVDVGGGQQISALVWGTAEPEIVFVHGGGQNAHTWDLVALGLGRPAIAIDLPGHGHSSRRDDRDYGPISNAEAVAAAIQQLAPHASGVVGMSLGGQTTIRLAAQHPELVAKAALVDVTPGSGEAHQQMTTEQKGTTALVGGPRSYPTREEMIEAAVQASPRRPASAVRRGVIHNTLQLPDGSWGWRYDRQDPTDGARDKRAQDSSQLWDDLERLAMPTMLVRGGESAFVTDAHLAEVVRRRPDIRVEVVPGAGHSIQSDKPQELTALIRDFIF
jgi:pimeloyl-ACP methyl ester carboxylesterase